VLWHDGGYSRWRGSGLVWARSCTGDLANYEFREARLPLKTELIPIMADEGVINLSKASSLQVSSPRSVCSRGYPRSGSSGSDDGDARSRSPSWGHHFGVSVGWRGQEVERCGIYVSSMMGLDGMAQRMLGDRCMLIEASSEDA
jgi:hypothetical protein